MPQPDDGAVYTRRVKRLGLALAFAAASLTLAAACAEAESGGAEGDAASSAPASDARELREQLVALDARVAELEARLGAIVRALGSDEVDDLSAQIALLAERVRALDGDLALSSPGAIDPLFCIDRSHPLYPQAEFDVYERGIPICGILP